LRLTSWRSRLVLALLGLIAIGVVIRGMASGPAPAPPAATPPLSTRPVARPPVAWLGLDYNSSFAAGSVGDFAQRGIVYDREGNIEVRSGSTPQNSTRLGAGLAKLYAAGMVPDIVVNPAGGTSGCEGNPNPNKLCLPTRAADIAAYVAAFVATAHSVLTAYPHHLALFEPMNEPWSWASPPGTPSGRTGATEYAAILAGVLQAARRAGIPLTSIYVPATDVLSDGTHWIADLYQSQPCLQPGTQSCGPVGGWNVHPYGLPGLATEGIDSVPRLHAQMRSGQNNVIISEIGFCALDVMGGHSCDKNRSDLSGSSSQTAAWLTRTLRAASVMHRAGWLKALLLWERSGSGWAMQNPDGSLTAQGRALALFADSQPSR